MSTPQGGLTKILHLPEGVGTPLPACLSLSWVPPGPELMTQVAKEKVVLCLAWFLLIRSFVRRSTV